MKKLVWALFGLYIALLLHMLFARASLNTGGPYWQQVRGNLNLAPLVTIRHQWYLLTLGKTWAVRSGVVNIFGNVIVFVPLGLGLPWLVRWLRRWWKTVAFFAMAISLVELAQLLTLRGYGDVDDLILNLLGVSIGYGLYRILIPKPEA